MQLHHRGVFWLGAAAIFGWLMITATIAGGFVLYSSACSVNPIVASHDVSQHAYALYGTFVVVEEQAATLMQNPTVSAPVKIAIQSADARAKPVADSLANALRDYETASTAFAAGTTSADKLKIATDNLSHWLDEAKTDISSLVTAVHRTTP